MYRVVVNIYAQNYVRITNLRMKKTTKKEKRKKKTNLTNESHINGADGRVERFDDAHVLLFIFSNIRITSRTHRREWSIYKHQCYGSLG